MKILEQVTLSQLVDPTWELNLQGVPNIQLNLKEGVYRPKLDTFVLAEALLRLVRESESVLDLGTGSGILAILAAKLGAARIVATDIHQESVTTAIANGRLNNVALRGAIGSMFTPLSDGERFNLIVANISSLPTSPNLPQNHSYVGRVVNAGSDGRKYLDILIEQAPCFLKKEGILLFQHSNFSNLEKSEMLLKQSGWGVELVIREYPIGQTSAERIPYFLGHLPKNCHPIKREGSWYQKIGVFTARR